MTTLQHKKNTITFNPDTHQYYINGLEALSVTTAFKKSGLDDFNGVPVDVLKRAQDFGNAVHSMVYLFNRDQLDPATLSQPLIPVLDGWKKFLAEHDIIILDSEKLVYSKRYWYCGRLDVECLIDGIHTVVDLKSGQLRPTIAMQTSGYQKAFNEMFPNNKITDRYCVQLMEGDYKKTKYEDKNDFNDFLTVLQFCGIKQKYK